MAEIVLPAISEGATYSLGPGKPTWVCRDGRWKRLSSGQVSAPVHRVATAGQTLFENLVYTPGFLEVNIAGIELLPEDYTAVNGTSVTVIKPCTAGQVATFKPMGVITALDAAQKSANGSDFPNKALVRQNIAVPFEVIEKRAIPGLALTIDFTNLPAGFDRFVLDVDGVGVVTDNTTLIMQVQSAGAWQTTNYGFVFQQGSLFFSAASEVYTGGILLVGTGAGNGVGNAAGRALSMAIDFNAKDTNSRRRFRFRGDFDRPDGVSIPLFGSGFWNSTAAITGVRLSTGNGSNFKTQGTITLLGIRN